MKKYRKKPVEIEAVQFDGDNSQEIIEWGGDHVYALQNSNLLIITDEGNMQALPTDWIIKGIAGEVYPCKDSIFKKTYEEV